MAFRLKPSKDIRAAIDLLVAYSFLFQRKHAEGKEILGCNIRILQDLISLHLSRNCLIMENFIAFNYACVCCSALL